MAAKELTKISKDTYRLVFRLYADQQWLAEREQKLFETLDLCDTIQEQELLTKLLHHFVYINSNELSTHLKGIADLICRQWNLDKTRVQLVATTRDYEPDSAQLMLQVLKSRLPAYGWGTVKQNNRFTRASKDLIKFPVVVLIDEFSGTGKTLLGRIRDLKRAALEQEKVHGKKIPLEIYIALLAAIEDVRPSVSAACTKFDARVWLRKGITGNFVDAELCRAIEDMNRLESTLKQDLQGLEFPSFGDGRAEALYALQNGNTPNSVFPIFWWPFLSNGTRRAPLLDRQDPRIP